MVRRSKGVLLPPVGERRLRRSDVYRALRNAVLDSTFSPGDRLPSSRQAAADYGVSRGLIEEVFGQLTDEGFLERRVGRGTFVSLQVGRLQTTGRKQLGQRALAEPSRRGLLISSNASCREPEEPLAFNAGIADTREFPWRLWCRLQSEALRHLGRAALDFADPRGLPQLRTAVARYLAQFRGIHCKAEQVMIFNSAQQALNTLAVLLLNPGDSVWMEDPCYLGARSAFELARANIISVPVDAEGIRVDFSRQRDLRARLAYVTPSHQYPTGVALSLQRRIELLQWAARCRAWIVEDDYDGEFRYAGQPLTSLYSLDSHGRVCYLGTLNKCMFVSLRIAYLVVPEEMVELLANIRTQMDGFTPALNQLTMSMFMDDGFFSSHLRRMRGLYGTKRATLTEGLAPLTQRGWTWSNNPAGMHLLIRHPRGAYVRTVVKSSSLDLALLSSYRSARLGDDGLFLRFGALSPAALEKGINDLLSAASRAAGGPS